MQFDALKTEELLSGLKAEGVETKDLSKILCKKIIGVRLRAGRGKMSVSIDLKSLGVNPDLTDKEVAAFKNENICNGSFRLFDKKVMSELENLISNTRQAVYRYAVSNDGSTYYMTSEGYKQFKEVYQNKYLKKFNELKEDLIENLPVHKVTFKNRLEKWFNTIGMDETEAAIKIKEYVSKFPTDVEVEKNCMLSYYSIAYPVFNETHLEGVSSEIANDLLEDQDKGTIEMFYSLVGNCLSKLFAITEKMIDTIEINVTSDEYLPLNINVSSRTKGLFNQILADVKDSNCILKNDKLTHLTDVLSRIYIDKKTAEDEDITNGEAVDISEHILGAIYGYATYLGIPECIAENVKSSNFTEEELEYIANSTDISKL